MNFYDELITKLDKLMDEKKYKEAEKLIDDELSMAYVPADIEEKLYAYKDEIRVHNFRSASLSEEELEECLFSDREHQLLAVAQLDKMNLRDQISLCEKYLKSNGFINAKVLLIESLIRQEIDHHFIYINEEDKYEFNPIDIRKPDEAEGFLSARKLLRDYYLKEPSKLLLAEQLLYRETLLALPFNLDHEDGLLVADKIEKYIDDAFEAGD